MFISRMWVIARNVFLEVIRDRVLYLIGLFALLMVLAVVMLPEVAAGAENKIILDVGLASINLLALVVAIFVGTGLINKEIEKKTVLVLIAKPVSRFEFILGKHLGLSAVMAVLIGALSAVFIALLKLKSIPFPLESVLLAVLFMFLEMVLLIAVAMLFGVFTSSLLATMMTFAVWLVGHLSQDIVRFGELAKSASFERLAHTLYLVLPDLERLNLKNEAIYGLTLLPSQQELLLNACYGLIYTALLLTITVTVFARRQF
ncbi:ABC transporter permease [Romeria aff. gracilis LEGE 07310]|uniref:ABC transporter permease n=1 Tax=Vasconcelosia minhoensis LEGE 07310 TaxID=915328 RepID=A0A8J7AIF4_9CYAN|nr:ABC transporter permease [Romeria gracilis]MBE9079559.1 ABC transporter permease [Romeria aff. gracilis LEGE 07310]